MWIERSTFVETYLPAPASKLGILMMSSWWAVPPEFPWFGRDSPSFSQKSQQPELTRMKWLRTAQPSRRQCSLAKFTRASAANSPTNSPRIPCRLTWAFPKKAKLARAAPLCSSMSRQPLFESRQRAAIPSPFSRRTRRFLSSEPNYLRQRTQTKAASLLSAIAGPLSRFEEWLA